MTKPLGKSLLSIPERLGSAQKRAMNQEDGAETGTATDSSEQEE